MSCAKFVCLVGGVLMAATPCSAFVGSVGMCMLGYQPTATPTPQAGTVVHAAPPIDLPASTPADAACCGSKSALTVQLNLDVASAYYFRGIRQEDRGVVVQPAAKFMMRLWERNDASLDAFVSTWNSFHTRRTGSDRDGFMGHWYELDGSGGVTYTSGKVSVTAAFVALNSPSNAFGTVQELDFTLAYDDSECMGKWAMHPYATLAVEVGANGSDGKDSDTGVYLELGIAPGLTFNLNGGGCCASGTPVTLTFPITLGLSLRDYYQNAAGDDSTFGYLQVGSKVSVPLCGDQNCGAWTLNAGVSALFLGSHTRDFNNGKRTEIIGSVGVQANF